MGRIASCNKVAAAEGFGEIEVSVGTSKNSRNAVAPDLSALELEVPRTPTNKTNACEWNLIMRAWASCKASRLSSPKRVGEREAAWLNGIIPAHG